MGIRFEVTGLEEIIKQCEEMATPREIEKASTLGIKNCLAITQTEVYNLFPESEDVSKSGRKGSRTYVHAAHMINSKILKKNGTVTGVVQVGDGKGDNEWFYVKWIEFKYGNSKYPPSQPFQKAFKKLRIEWDRILQAEYEKLVEKLS